MSETIRTANPVGTLLQGTLDFKKLATPAVAAKPAIGMVKDVLVIAREASEGKGMPELMKSAGKAFEKVQDGLVAQRAAYAQAKEKAEKDTNVVIRTFDRNRDNALDVKELDAWVGHYKGGDAKKTAEYIDTNKDGKLTKGEIQDGLTRKYAPPGAREAMAGGKVLAMGSALVERASGLTDMAKTMLYPTKMALSIVGGSETMVKAVDAMGEAVDEAGKYILKAKDAIEKMKPIEYSPAEKAQIKKAVPVLAKLAGADEVWTAGDRARNLEQMQGSLNQRVDQEIDSQFAEQTAARGPLRRAVKTTVGNIHMNRHYCEYKTDGMKEANGIASWGLYDGQKQMEIPNDLEHESRPATEEGKKAAAQPISIAEVEYFSDTMRMIEAKAKAAGKPDAGFEKGLPVQFLRDMAADHQPIIPAGATLHPGDLMIGLKTQLP